MKTRTAWIAVLLVFVSVSVLSAQRRVVVHRGGGGGYGEGGCIIHDNAPVYNEEGKVLGHGSPLAHDGTDCVAGITTRGILDPEFTFEHADNGRVHVAFFPNKEQKGLYRTAWLDPADLSTFTYECGCGSTPKSRELCSPFTGLFSFSWNVCFAKARDEKVAELKSPQVTEKPLTNDDVIALIKADLGDDVVIAKIKNADNAHLSASVDDLLRLKKEGASKAVIEALVKRTGEK